MCVRVSECLYLDHVPDLLFESSEEKHVITDFPLLVLFHSEALKLALGLEMDTLKQQ